MAAVHRQDGTRHVRTRIRAHEQQRTFQLARLPKPPLEPLAIERLYIDNNFSIAKAQRDLGYRPLFTTREAIGPAQEDLASLGANGILGIGFFISDCGGACAAAGSGGQRTRSAADTCAVAVELGQSA